MSALRALRDHAGVFGTSSQSSPLAAASVIAGTPQGGGASAGSAPLKEDLEKHGERVNKTLLDAI